MSKDVATLAQAIGTVAKFTRVMQNAGLPDEFYQKVIDNPELREELAQFAQGMYTNARGLVASAIRQLEHFEKDLSILGISVKDAKREDYLSVNHNFSFTRTCKIDQGNVTLTWTLKVEEVAGGADTVITLWLRLNDHKPAPQRNWSIDVVNTSHGASIISAELLMHKQLADGTTAPEELSDLTPEERWFVTHCAFFNWRVCQYLFHRDGERPDLKLHSEMDVYQQVKIMVETFKSCHGYFEREHTADEVACPRCGGKGIPCKPSFIYEHIGPRVTEDNLYECTSGCRMVVDEVYPHGETIETALQFVFEKNWGPHEAIVMQGDA